MPHVLKTPETNPEIQPDNTPYGPMAVTVKTVAHESAARPDDYNDDLAKRPGVNLTLPPHRPRPHGSHRPHGSSGPPAGKESGLGSVRSKIVFLILSLSFASFIGFGILLVNSFHETPDAAQRTSFIIAVVVFLIMLAITVVIISVLSRWVFTPLKKTSLAFEALARGDLSYDIAVEGTSELAQIAKALSQTQESIKEITRNVGERAQTLSSAGNEMQRKLNDSVEVINKVNVNIKDLQTKSSSHIESFTKANLTMTEIISGIKNLGTDIEEQAESVSQSSVSIKEMVSSFTSITTNLARNEEDLQRLREASAEGNSSLQKVSGDIQEVAKESERLLEINKVIQNIASQTNLLAMNAAIEAAHAGDVGRGFAVVADEIRKLAESSSKQAKTVSVVLKNIKNALGNISSSTLASLSQFGDIDKGFESVSVKSMEIRQSMERQDAGNQKVLSAMSASNEIGGNVRRDSSRIQNASQEIARESRALENLTRELTNAIGEITSDIENIRAAVSRSSEISQKNRNDIDNLTREIGKFSA